MIPVEIIKKWAARAGIPMDRVRLDVFLRFGEMLLTRNRQFNLTAITDEREIAVKHFVDSLEPAARVPELRALLGARETPAVPTAPAVPGVAAAPTVLGVAHIPAIVSTAPAVPVTVPAAVPRLLDIGSGAGFPGIPLKILFGGALDVTLMDSTAKKVAFMNEAAAALGLTGCAAVHARAEETGRRQDMRGCFNFVTARAVAVMPALLSYCLPFLAPGGLLIALKGRREIAERELADAMVAKRGALPPTASGGHFRAPVSYALETGDERTLVVFERG